MTSVHCIDLGPGQDRLLRFNIKDDTNGASVIPPKTLLILDVSGSMGRWVAKSEQAVGKALLDMGYPLDMIVEEVMFSGYAFHESRTVQQMINSSRRDMGTTQMRDVFGYVERLLLRDQNQAYQIIMISDGIVFDRDQIGGLANEFAARVSKRAAPISVVLIRLKTDRDGSPDTKALSYIGQLNTQGVVAVNDIDGFNVAEDQSTMMQIVTTVTAHFARSGSQIWEINCLSAGSAGSVGVTTLLRRLPTDTYRRSIMVPSGTNFVMVSPDVDLSTLKITLGGQPITVTSSSDVLNNEEEIADLLKYVEQQVRLWLVMGTQGDQIQRTMTWLRHLSQRIVAAEAAQAAQSSESGSSVLRGRATQLYKTIHKREKSIINRIMQLENQGKIDKLNVQQQADFLRQVGDNRTGKRLANRAMTKDAEFDYDSLCRTALQRLINNQDAVSLEERPGDPVVSFYSHMSMVDVVSDAREVGQALTDVINETKADDLLQLVGGVGLCYNGPVGDYPDPWRYYVSHVYPGCYLAQADLWMAHVQGHGAKLQVPGRAGQIVTGVDVIRATNGKIYDLLARKAGDLLEVQTSLSMRRLKLRVPGDDVALKTAVTYRLIQQMGEADRVSELDARTLMWELFDLGHFLRTRYHKSFEQVSSDLHQAQVGAYLTGDRDISGALQPICALLGDSRVSDLLNNREQLSRILRSLFSLEVYHRVRSTAKAASTAAGQTDWMAKNTEMLHEMLGITKQKLENIKVEDEYPDYPTECDQSHLLHVARRYAPLGYSMTSLARVLAVRRAFEEAQTEVEDSRELLFPTFMAKLGTAFNELNSISDFALHLTPDRYLAVLVLQSMMAPDLAQRIDTATRVVKLPDIVTEGAAEDFIKEVVQKIYREDHQRRKNVWATLMMEREAMRFAYESGLDTFKGSMRGHTHTGHTRKSFWDTLAGAIQSGSVEKVEAFLAKSNKELARGTRFDKFIRKYGNAAIRKRFLGCA